MSWFRIRAANSILRMSRLWRAFERLSLPQRGDSQSLSFGGTQLPDQGRHHLAKDVQGRPALLFSVQSSRSSPAAVTLKNLRVEHDVLCNISRSDGTVHSGSFTLVHCLSPDKALHCYFLQTMETLIPAIIKNPSKHGVAEAIEMLAALFLAMQKPPTKSVQGLWAELFLIQQARTPLVLLASWHLETAERFDFSVRSERIEVKSATDRVRNHHFSLEQAYPPSGVTLIIASLFLERRTSGLSLGELWDAIRQQAAGVPDLRLKVDQVCMTALGNQWQEARDRRYDEQLARDSLLFFDIRDIPRLPVELPSGVSEVRFRSNLMSTKPIDNRQYSRIGPLFEACLGCL